MVDITTAGAASVTPSENARPIDAKRGLIFVATGDSYTDVKENGSDAIVALDLTTGAVKWKTQVTANDNYLSGCEAGRLVNCPSPLGHDVDFGASPMLVTLPTGADILIARQKSGIVYGLEPHRGGFFGRPRWAKAARSAGSSGAWALTASAPMSPTPTSSCPLYPEVEITLIDEFYPNGYASRPNQATDGGRTFTS